MFRSHRGLAFFFAGVASACAGLNVGDEAGCADACTAAYTCGLLPSTLGYGENAELARSQCESRCGRSPRDDEDVVRILECLQGTAEPPDDLMAWCGDVDDPSYAAGLKCAAAVSCLGSMVKGEHLIADATLDVSLITFDDFESVFGGGSVEELYAGIGSIQSCSPALCGRTDCMRGDETDLPCNSIFCRSVVTQVGSVCDGLQVDTVEIIVEQRPGEMNVKSLFDGSDPAACREPLVSFATDNYTLRPGPAQTFARFRGVLLSPDIERLWDVAGEGATTEGDGDSTDGDGTVDAPYCVQFVGMSVTLRGGENAALVPVGSIDEMIEFKAKPIPCGP